MDIMIKKQKDLDDKMSTMAQDINTITQNLSTMTQNHNTLMEVLQKLMPSIVSSLDMLDTSFHVSTHETLSKNKEYLQKEIKINNVTLKQEIETKILLDMEARLNNKIEAIGKIVENKKVKNRQQQQSSSNMLVASSNSSEPPSNCKIKGNQYHPYIVYPPKAKIELSHWK